MFKSAKFCGFIAAVGTALILGAGVRAQDQQEDRLADVRLQLLDLYGQMEQLRRELTPRGPKQREVGISDLTALRRLDGLEQELRGAIAKIEELEFRILRIAADGNNQIRDLELTLAQAVGGDVSQIARGEPLGAELRRTEPVAADGGGAVVADLSALEAEMFDKAFETYQKNEIEAARERFQALVDAYPEGRFAAEAYYYIGETFVYDRVWSEAGKAFLAAFNQEPDGPTAPKALLRLGESLAQHGNQAEACKILKNVGAMFPDSGEAGLADAQVAELGCG